MLNALGNFISRISTIVTTIIADHDACHNVETKLASKLPYMCAVYRPFPPQAVLVTDIYAGLAKGVVSICNFAALSRTVNSAYRCFSPSS